VTDPNPGFPDHAAPPLRTIGWSPKALFGALAAVLAPVLVQLLGQLVETLSSNPALFDGLPPLAVLAINVVVSGVGALLAARKAPPGTVVHDS
jgi:hypothetical protein